MTVLVTGSAGHLGEAMMRSLRADGIGARGLDRKPSPFTDLVGSVVDRALLRDAMDGVTAVVHAATLHKPHVATHAAQDFVDVNVSGTLALLEAAASARVSAFVFTSTTSTFGSALTPAAGAPAAWITEDVPPVPKNIYGTTKVAAEGLCELFARRERLPVVILRTARFFPEHDDDPAVRAGYDPLNAQANELLYRRADIADVVDAHRAAIDRAGSVGFGRFIVSATPPFSPTDATALRTDAAAVVSRLFPDFPALYAAKGWRMFETIDRIYDSGQARSALGWQPRHDFRSVLDALREGADFRSPLARAVGSKGYHDVAFEDGPYPVA